MLTTTISKVRITKLSSINGNTQYNFLFSGLKLSFGARDILIIYRSPNEAFRKKFGQFIENVLSMIDRPQTVVCGDFNLDYRKAPNNAFSQAMASRGFVQIIKEPTIIHGTTIDHVYIRNMQSKYFLHYPYYTLHEAACVMLKKLKNKRK